MTLIYRYFHSRTFYNKFFFFFNFLYRLSYQLQMKTILFLPQKSVYIYFILLCSFTDRISSMMLKKNSERRHPCLVPDLRGKAYCFSPFSIMIAVDFTQIIFIELLSLFLHRLFLLSYYFYFIPFTSQFSENFCEWVMDFVKYFFLY